MSDAVFVPDGDRFVPTGMARGPWDPNQMHGGAPAALLARAIEAAVVTDDSEDMAVVRVTLELLRAVPIAPVTVVTEVVRPGKRVQLVGASLVGDDGTTHARAVGLRIRRDRELDLAVHDEADPSPPPFTDHPIVFGFTDDVEHFAALWEWRATSDADFVRQAGPTAIWARLTTPIVAGEPTTALMRCAALADFGNGISSVLDFDQALFVNPDLTVYLHREPVGEWLCLDAVTWASPDGRGYAESAIWDRHGRVGRAVQGLYLAPR